MQTKDAVGRYGEELAARHLRTQGIEVVEQNWRCRQGELDIVGREGDVLVFCEVKTRSSMQFGLPAEAVGPEKAGRIRRLAAAWLAERRPAYGELRFDVVSVVRSPQGVALVEHLRGAF